MAQSAVDEETSPAPTMTEGGTPAGAAEAGVAAAVHEGVGEMKAADVAAVDVPDEAEPTDTVGAEPEDEEPEETAEDDPDEESEEEEEEEEGGDEGTLMEPLAMVKPGEVQQEDEKPSGVDEESEDAGETVMEPVAMVKPGEVQEEDEERSGADEESEEAAPEEPKEVGEGAEGLGGDGMAEDAAKSLVEGSTVDGMNGQPSEKPVEFGDADQHDVNVKDGVTGRLSNSGDAGGSGNCDELSGGLEVFVDELPKDCAEEDIAMILSQSGEIKSVQIIRNSSTGKSKDIAFVCYANIEAARNALAKFMEGIEVKGKKVKVSACEDNNTLFLGNICKSWTKNEVLNTLKSMGIGQFNMDLRSDKKGRFRGFAFLEFSSHYYARAAFRRLLRSDAVFGIGRSAKVSFARTPTKPTDEFVMQVKTVYLEHVPLSWDEETIKESCERYGKIQNVNIFQISEKKTFSFVEFSSSKSASACVEGINRANIVDGDFMLSASLARPKGGFKVTSGVALEDAKTSKKKDAKISTGGVASERNVMRKSSSNKLPNGNESKQSSHGASEVPQTSNPSKGKRTVLNIKNTSFNQGPSKKARSSRNIDEKKLTHQDATEVPQSSSLSKRKRKAGKNSNTYVSERLSKKTRNNRNLLARASNTTHPGRYDRGIGKAAGPCYAFDSQAYPSTRATSRSKVHASDLEPHAGYIPPVDQVHSTHASTRLNVHQTDVPRYAREAAAPRPAYSGYTSHDGFQAEYEYIYPPPSTSGSYYRRSGSYITRRGDY